MVQVGNHDVGDFYPHEEWSQRVQRFEQTLGAANRVERVRGVSFVLLNTMALTAPDHPPHTQRRAVMDVVARAANESASSVARVNSLQRGLGGQERGNTACVLTWSNPSLTHA
jgi:hypothetical protein